MTSEDYVLEVRSFVVKMFSQECFFHKTLLVGCVRLEYCDTRIAIYQFISSLQMWILIVFCSYFEAMATVIA